jgi:hypothetical protein
MKNYHAAGAFHRFELIEMFIIKPVHVFRYGPLQNLAK